MRRFRSAWLAAASALVYIAIAGAARPRYGGTLRVETSAAMRSLNPAATPLDAADAAAHRLISPLIFETLVEAAPEGGIRPLLAVDWERDARAARWRFRLRSGVKLHDGTPLDAGRVVAALSASAPDWRVTSDAFTIAIESDRELPDLLWQLAQTRHAVAFGRPRGGEPIGTGPFAIERWEPKRLRLRAHADHWGGRPFVDAVHIEMGRPLVEQMTSLEVGRADFVSLRAQDVRRASERGFQVVASRPLELIALVFADTSPGMAAARRAIALAVDRTAMSTALLQRQGQPADTLLPDWLSGYAAVAGSPHDRALARSTVAAIPAAQRTLTLGIPDPDPLLRSIAERVAVEARDVGLVLNVESPDSRPRRTSDVRLVRAGMAATTPDRALATLLHALGLRPANVPGEGTPGVGAPLDAVYRFERALLDQHAVVPLVHAAHLYATAPRVDTWNDPVVLPSGRWNLADAWLRGEVP